MLLIYESALPSSISNVKSDNQDTVEFIATMQEANVKNRNRRIYPKEVIDAALHGPIIEEKLRTNTLFGEVGHPLNPDLNRQANVDMRNASFRIENFWWEGNLLKAKCKTLPTSLGKDMAALIKEGCVLSFSMRGQGNIKEDRYNDALVVTSLNIITFDWVWLPSHNTAYISSLCEDTQYSLFKQKNITKKALTSNEAVLLYESGSVFDLAENKTEKPFKDYYKNYSNKYIPISEAYTYSPKDKIIEKHNSYFILENDNYKMKVSSDDYISKAIKYSVLEDISGLAPTDTHYEYNGTTKDDEAPKLNYKLHSVDKIDVSPIKNEGLTEPISTAATITKKDGTGSDGVAQPEGKLLNVNDNEVTLTKDLEKKNKYLEFDNSVDDLSWERISGDKFNSLKKNFKENAKLKEEFENIYNIVKEEAHLNEDCDIIKYALNYSDFMSEDCKKIFTKLAK